MEKNSYLWTWSWENWMEVSGCRWIESYFQKHPSPIRYKRLIDKCIYGWRVEPTLHLSQPQCLSGLPAKRWIVKGKIVSKAFHEQNHASSCYFVTLLLYMLIAIDYYLTTTEDQYTYRHSSHVLPHRNDILFYSMIVPYNQDIIDRRNEWWRAR